MRNFLLVAFCGILPNPCFATQVIDDRNVGTPEVNRLKVIIETSIKPNEKVGALKKGMLCLPAGSISWEQLKLPSESALAERLIPIFQAKSSAIINALEAEPQLLTLRIDAIEVSQCSAGLGIGEMKPKSKLEIAIAWRLTSARDSASVNWQASGVLKVERPDSDVRSSSSAIENAIELSLIEALVGPNNPVGRIANAP